MENRIKEQMCLFADRLSTDEMKGNQLRLYFSALAYSLMEALRRLGLKGTAWAEAQVDTIRLKLLKIGAIVHLSVRRVLLQLSSAYPWKDSLHSRLPRSALLNFAQLKDNPKSTSTDLSGRQSRAPNTPPNLKATLLWPKSDPAEPTRAQTMITTTQISNALSLKSKPMRNRG